MTANAVRSVRQRQQSRARRRIETFYPVLVRKFPENSRGLDRAKEAIAKVACNILASPACTRRLATTENPHAYLYRSVQNALRLAPSNKDLILSHHESIEVDGSTKSGAAPRCLMPQPWRKAAQMELSTLIALLVSRLPQPKRGMMILWMRGYTSPEIERTLGWPRATVRYHVSTSLAKLKTELMRAAWQFILTDFPLMDCIPMTA